MTRRNSPTDDLRDLRGVFSVELGLSASERTVLAVLILHRNGKTGRLDPSVPTIVRKSGLGRSTVLRVLASLEAGGHLVRDQRSGRRTKYALNLSIRPTAGLVSQRDQSQSGTGPVSERDGTRPGVGPERTKERTKERAKNTMGDESPGGDHDMTKRPTSFPPLSKLPKNGRTRIYPPEFEGAFQALPQRHVAHPKAAAYNAWRVCVQDVEVEEFQPEAAALAYAEDMEARDRVGTEFVLQAATFFGPGERWRPYSGIDAVKKGAPRGSDGGAVTPARLREMFE